MLRIGSRAIGPGHPCFVIAEVAQAHDGSLGQAHAYIDAAARAGADAVKFQTHIASAESTPREAFRVHFSPQDATRFEYWKRMEFTPAQWAALAQHARDRGLVFLSSAFSPEAVELLRRLDVPAWKVGSGEVNTLPLLEQMAATGRPVLLSSGMSPWRDLDLAVRTVRTHGAPVAVFQCTTAYPTPPEKVGLNVLSELRERYGCPVGLSDHSARIETGLAAVTLGADLLEVHLVFSHECFGPDASSSLTVDDLARLVEGVRWIETVLAHPVNKAVVADDLADLRTLFGKSVVLARDLPEGHRLERGDLALKKPGGGLPANRLDEVVGRVLSKPVARDAAITEEDLV